MKFLTFLLVMHLGIFSITLGQRQARPSNQSERITDIAGHSELQGDFDSLLLDNSTQELQLKYLFHKKKSREHLISAIIGSTLGLAATSVGTAIAISNIPIMGPGNGRSDMGIVLMISGFILGAATGIPGFIQGKTNANKARSIKNELDRRKAPLEVKLSPSVSPSLQTGQIRLTVHF
ncbi:hypothetical protein [Dyadobacter tibetensis]|uniref:hypothetical protein n=1 Tax=Dyadobacter tibetensis TaxID=1211851 RepID=UPI00046EB6B2|nr:hypothetical protein [Dyadobacter tibetensis]